ncbi:MAG: hypothetical protein AAF959_17950 [Cyanobacteria bacterium P01_D01_bin.56]
MYKPPSRTNIKPEDLEKLKIFEIKGFGLKKTNRSIKYEWDDLTDKQRLAALQECENRISKYEKRPSIPLYVKDFDKIAHDTYNSEHQFNPKHTDYEENKAHYIHRQNPKQRRIEFDLAFFSKPHNRYKIIETFFEESRHAYQLDSLDQVDSLGKPLSNARSIHARPEEVEAWIEHRESKKSLENHLSEEGQKPVKKGASPSGLSECEAKERLKLLYKRGPLETFAKGEAEMLTNALKEHHKAIKTDYWWSKEPLLSPRAKRNLTTNNQRLAELKKTPKKTKSRKP